MLNKLDHTLLKNELTETGYTVIPNYLDENDLNSIKKSFSTTLDYIKKNNLNNLQEKYYFIREHNRKLKGNFYKLSAFNLDMINFLHNPVLINFIKDFYKTDVLFSGRSAVHIHDDENMHLLDPHQETSQIAVNSILLWIPLYDTNKNTGGLTVYENSHKHGYFEHTLEHPRLGDKAWTKEYTHVSPEVANRFKKINLEINAGSAVLVQSAVIHCGYPNLTKDFARFVITERFNPLLKIPYLRKEDAPLKIPFTGVDYNAIED